MTLSDALLGVSKRRTALLLVLVFTNVRRLSAFDIPPAEVSARETAKTLWGLVVPMPTLPFAAKTNCVELTPKLPAIPRLACGLVVPMPTLPAPVTLKSEESDEEKTRKRSADWLVTPLMVKGMAVVEVAPMVRTERPEGVVVPKAACPPAEKTKRVVGEAAPSWRRRRSPKESEFHMA